MYSWLYKLRCTLALSVLFIVAIPTLVGCILFADGLFLLVPVLLLEVQFRFSWHTHDSLYSSLKDQL